MSTLHRTRYGSLLDFCRVRHVRLNFINVINDIKYKKSSVVALSNKAQADQSKVIILKGDI